MAHTESRLLKATWLPGQLRTVDPPHVLLWEDGRVGTYAEYLSHEDDTQSTCELPSGIVTLIYPDVVADARYCCTSGRWLVSGIGSEPLTLCLDDPAAEDVDVQAEVETELFRYRVRVLR